MKIMNVDWGQAVLIFVLGVGTVFAVLIILWGILAAMKMISSKSSDEEKTEVPKASATKNANVDTRKMSEPKAYATKAPEDENELLAIFTAAVNACGNSTALRVTSYKKTN